MNITYCYVTKTALGSGEFAVEGKTAEGRLVFGFRTFDTLGLQAKARSYTPSQYLPVFDRPACLVGQ